MNKGNLSDSDMEAYKYTYSQPGALTAYVNYYRAMFTQKRAKRSSQKMIETPTLLIWVYTSIQCHSLNGH